MGALNYFVLASAENASPQYRPFLQVQFQNRYPTKPNEALMTPASGTTTMSTTPTLTAPATTDPDGDAVRYWFRVATSPNGEAAAANSGWLDFAPGVTPSWTVPVGVLNAGVTYYWKVFVGDRWDPVPTASTWPPSTLKVDLRLGSGGPSPMESAGPVGLNLATGNAVVSVSTPSLPAVGGPVGLSLTYNSKAPPNYGLTGQYWSNPDRSGAPFLTRLDPQVDFDWKAFGPAPGMPTDGFSATWEGYVSAPVSAGDWQLGVVQDDGVKAWVNNTQVIDRWADQGAGAVNWSSTFSLTQGQPVPIRIDYYENVGDATIRLYARATGVPEQVVPATWLRSDRPALPDGWVLSAGADGGGGVHLGQGDLRCLRGPGGLGRHRGVQVAVRHLGPACR